MNNINEIIKKRCLLAFIVCLLIVVTTFLGVVNRVLTPKNPESVLFGKDVFRYFTVLSNIFVNGCAIMCIPFEIEGLLKQNYHLPRWIVDFLYVGVTCTTITLIVASFLIAPTTGFVYAFLDNSLIFLHLICPILALLLFLFVNVDHEIKANRMFIAILPVLFYMVTYVINVFVIPEYSDWKDHYYIKGNIDLWLVIILVLAVSLLTAYLLRKYHNKLHFKYKAMLEQNFNVNNANIIEAVKDLALEDSKKYVEGDIAVPVYAINIMRKTYGSDYSVDDLYKVYLQTFLSSDSTNLNNLEDVRLTIYKPEYEDLWFRQLLLADEKTMSYNHSYGGAVTFSKEKWDEWFNYWIVNNEGKRYYRYLVDEEDNFIGEIAFYYDDEFDQYIGNIIIYAKYRCKGLGEIALNMLCFAAKKNGIQVLYDNVAIDNPAIDFLLKRGFVEEYRTEEYVMLKKNLD